MPARATTVPDYLDACDPAGRATIEALRSVVRKAAPELTEEIKWNAPSYRLGDADRVTLGLSPKGVARLVLHRGAAVQDAGGFAFDDPDGMAKWPAPDRGVAEFRDAAAVAAAAAPLRALVARWIAANR